MMQMLRPVHALPCLPPACLSHIETATHLGNSVLDRVTQRELPFLPVSSSYLQTSPSGEPTHKLQPT